MTFGEIIDWQIARQRTFWANPSLWHLAGPWAMVILLTALLISARIADLNSAKHEAQGIATVLGMDSSNHDCYRYALSVNGRSYTNCGFPREGSLAVGDRVIAYYDSEDPSRNHLHGFKDEIDNDSFLIGVVWIFFGFVPTAFVLWRRYLHQKRQRSKPAAL
jgi:hypothetical protein